MTEPKHQEPNTPKENSVASSSANEQTSSESKALWKVPFTYIASLPNDERIRLVTAITIASLVLLGGMVVTLVILVQFFDIKIDKNGLILNPKQRVVQPIVTSTNPPKVEPTATPTTKELTPEVLREFQKEALGKDTYRRNWIGPDGEEISSNDLDPCLLVLNDSGQPRWGQLLAQVMEKPGSARTDPFKILRDNNLTPRELKFVYERTQTTLEVPRNGYLTFIINEAVFTDSSNYTQESLPQKKECIRGYEALLAASKSLKNQGQNDYVIHPGSIPLIWYSDNIGSFQVIVKNEKKQFIARVMVDSTAGFQNSGIYLKKGDKVILEADGRVHLALRQVHTFAGSVRAIIEHEKAK